MHARLKEEFDILDKAHVGVKTGRSREGGPKLYVMDRWVTGDRGHDVYPGSGPLNGGHTLLPALLILMNIEITRVDLPRDHMLWFKT